MTPEDKKRIEEHTAEIAKILYRNAEAKNAEQLKTLEGIEVAVREQILENVSPNIGIFLSRQAVEQRQGEPDN
jgi:flagellar basal body-associated protein FliL